MIEIKFSNLMIFVKEKVVKTKLSIWNINTSESSMHNFLQNYKVGARHRTSKKNYNN